MTNIQDYEIQRGLVLHLSPRKMKRRGATIRSRRQPYSGGGGHYFLCLHAEWEESWWTPIFEKAPQSFQVRIPASVKSGSPKWRNLDSHCDPTQVWRVSNQGAVAAAYKGNDKTAPDKRNLVPDAVAVELAVQSMGTADIAGHEMRRGLVLRMEPEAMHEHGADVACNDLDHAARGVHFFLCVHATVAESRWVPLYSNERVYRLLIPSGEKLGHPNWSERDSYCDPHQVWRISNEGAVAAAQAGNDLSRPSARNEVMEEAVSRIDPPLMRQAA